MRRMMDSRLKALDERVCFVVGFGWSSWRACRICPFIFCSSGTIAVGYLD
jgi:hypothetical protein